MSTELLLESSTRKNERNLCNELRNNILFQKLFNWLIQIQIHYSVNKIKIKKGNNAKLLRRHFCRKIKKMSDIIIISLRRSLMDQLLQSHILFVDKANARIGKRNIIKT